MNKLASRSILVIIVIVFGIIGIVFASIGGVMYFNERSNKDKYTGSAEATVIEICSQNSNSNSSSYNNNSSNTYAPRLSYTVDKQEYQNTRSVYTNPCDYNIGQVVAIKFDKSNPNKFYIVGDNSFAIFYYVFGGIGLLFILIAIIIFIIQLKIRKKSSFIEKELQSENSEDYYGNK